MNFLRIIVASQHRLFIEQRSRGSTTNSIKVNDESTRTNVRPILTIVTTSNNVVPVLMIYKSLRLSLQSTKLVAACKQNLERPTKKKEKTEQNQVVCSVLAPCFLFLSSEQSLYPQNNFKLVLRRCQFCGGIVWVDARFHMISSTTGDARCPVSCYKLFMSISSIHCRRSTIKCMDTL